MKMNVGVSVDYEYYVIYYNLVVSNWKVCEIVCIV